MNTTLEELLKIAKPAMPLKELMGKQLTVVAFQELDDELKLKIPHWYRDMLTRYPIAGLILRFTTLSDEVKAIQFLDFDEISDNYHVLEPGMRLGKFNLICIGDDPTGGRHPYFIDITEGDNPPVYQVRYDVTTEDREALDPKDKIKVVDALSDIFGQQGE